MPDNTVCRPEGDAVQPARPSGLVREGNEICSTVKPRYND
jgi:hypothetical protein